MANSNGWLKRYVMSFSFWERRTRELESYRKRVSELENMDSDEIDFEYISLKSEYEHKKSILTILLITIALSFLMNVWKNFFVFIEKAMQYSSTFDSGGMEMEIAKLSLIISAIVIAFLAFIILAILASYMKEIRRTQKELMIVEEVRINGLKNRYQFHLGSRKVGEYYEEEK